MKIYFAGTTVSEPREQCIIQQLFKEGSKLHSYFHCSNNGFEQDWFEMNTKNKVDLFLDSGAFSARSQGAKIDIQEYIQFIKEHEDVIDVYANLDVIGDAKATYKNQRTMEKAGLSPLPVFHQGEKIWYLERYLERYDYIAFGGMVGSNSGTLILWLDRIFQDFICDSRGLPKVKVHGFGLTSLKLMLRYPWYSVDSTSWVTTGRMGSIYVPRFRNGQWIYDENSWKIAVSNRSPSAKEAGQHIETLPPMQKQVILDYIHGKGYQLGKSVFKKVSDVYKPKDGERWAEKKAEAKHGKRLLEIIKEDGISNRYQLRDEMNIIYFLDLEKSMLEWPWPFTARKNNKGLFT